MRQTASVFVAVTVSVAHLVSMEVFGGAVPSVPGSVAVVWKITAIAVIRMKVIVYMTAEVIGAMKPRAGTDEDSAAKPLRAIVAVGSTAVRSSVIISIRAVWSYTDVDADLSLCFGRICQEAQTGDCR
jgi:uncharacterized cupredoxin-like copper-binding protein